MAVKDEIERLLKEYGKLKESGSRQNQAPSLFANFVHTSRKLGVHCLLLP